MKGEKITHMGILDKLKPNKPTEQDNKKNLDFILIFVLIVIVGLLYFSSFFTQQPKNDTDTSAPTANTAVNSSDDLEQKLKGVLSKIEGAGQVDVMITYETGSQIVPALSVEETTSKKTNNSNDNTDTSETKSTSTKPVTVSNGGENSVLVLVKKEPVVKGVIVVAEGAADIKTKLELQRAVQTVLNIDSSNIDIFAMEK